MFAFLRVPQCDLRRPSAGLAKAVVLSGSALFLAGCLPSHTSPFAGRSDIGNPAIALQRAHMAQMHKPRVEDLEDDGLPVQTAPFRTRQKRPDDPTEPFSPNYGSRGTISDKRDQEAWAPQAAPAPRASVAGWRKLDPVEAEIAVSRAMAEHERRYP